MLFRSGLDGVTIKLNGGAYTAVTADGGRFCFENLVPGTYVVAVDESTAPGYYPTGPVSIVVELEPGESEEVFFGNAPYGSISGRKWLDADADGVWSDSETVVIEGVTIKLYEGDPPAELVGTAVTGEDGSYSFTGLFPGEYRVVEVLPAGNSAARLRVSSGFDDHGLPRRLNRSLVRALPFHS